MATVIDIKNAIEIIGNDKLFSYYLDTVQNEFLNGYEALDYVGINSEIQPALNEITDNLNCKKIINLEKLK